MTINCEQQPCPLLPVRDVVVYPGAMVPLIVGRKKSVAALRKALEKGETILIAAQKEAAMDNPGPDDIYDVGTISRIVQVVDLPEENMKILLEGKSRVKITGFMENPRYFEVTCDLLPEETGNQQQARRIMQRAIQQLNKMIALGKSFPQEPLGTIENIEDANRFSFFLSHFLSASVKNKQILLEIDDPVTRLENVIQILDSEIEMLELEQEIKDKVQKRVETTQREFFLQEKMKVIQEELGRKDAFKSEIEELRERMKTVGPPKSVTEKISKEIDKLDQMPPMFAESTVVRNYVEWVLSIPWKKRTRENRDLRRAERILEEDHYGLSKIKERILEFLAVHQLVKKMKGPILCFVGPPGVGKTSLAKSIARAAGRKFVRVSLGGIRDEAEIRGHRRTYIGSMPGRIIQSMKRAGTVNPVFLLDEIDKMNTDFRGDPASALLEVLDPEQNHAFSDHYLEVDYDLSQVMFITTANLETRIPLPLKDRMEVIRLTGYTDEEKTQIAEKFLIPKQLKAHGLKSKNIRYARRGLEGIIRNYTKEAGVRNLEREIANTCRKVARQVVTKGKSFSYAITEKRLNKLLGVIRFPDKKVEQEAFVGLATGLAWTELGGEILQVETLIVPGTGKLNLTGSLGDVMQESAQAALSFVRSIGRELDLPKNFHRRIDAHIHVPEGAVPKDGPSAGITLAISLISALIKLPVRKNVAMTGEITLRGRILPIGGLKEKVLAAYRSGIDTVLIPHENERDLPDIPKEIRNEVKIVFISKVEGAIEKAFYQNPLKSAPAEQPATAQPEAPVLPSANQTH